MVLLKFPLVSKRKKGSRGGGGVLFKDVLEEFLEMSEKWRGLSGAVLGCFQKRFRGFCKSCNILGGENAPRHRQIDLFLSTHVHAAHEVGTY